jgi:hypothetical protein
VEDALVGPFADRISAPDTPTDQEDTP